MIIARALMPEETAIWRTLRLDGICRYPGAFLAEEAEAQAIPQEQDRAMLRTGTRFGAFEGVTCIGIAGINRYAIARAAHRAEVGPFYVMPCAQGKEAAKSLMQAVIEYARRIGIWQLDLTVAETNRRAIGFYESCGFERMGRVPNAIIGAQGPEDDAFYVLTLPRD